MTPLRALAQLRDDVRRVAALLPGQGPINVFIHHNTLHAFEGRPFEEAVVEAGQLFGCQPFLSAKAYRAELERGRITERDLRRVIDADLAERGHERLAGLIERRELRYRIAAHGIAELREPALGWRLYEQGDADRLREDLPADARSVLEGVSGGLASLQREADLVRALWRASLGAIARSGPIDDARRAPVPSTTVGPQQAREWLLGRHGIDVTESVEPLLIRFVGAYLDQGLAHWPLHGREHGLYAAFANAYGRRQARLAGPWVRQLTFLLHQDADCSRTALESLAHSLHVLGVGEDERHDYLVGTALALRGWAGMIRQMEMRPDRMPVRAEPARLEDYLAIRLLCERAALTHAAQRLGLANCAELSDAAKRDAPQDAGASSLTPEERAWRVFQAAQLGGIGPAILEQLSASDCRRLEDELTAFGPVDRRRCLHLAFELQLRCSLFDALVQHEPQTPPEAPVFQALFCIDEREESFRRHLEEVEPRAETLGAAGFFGVGMYYRGITDARPRPLAPATLQPQHFVAELQEQPRSRGERWRQRIERALALANKNVHIGSRTLARGALLMSALGTLSLIPLVLRVVMPGLGTRLGRYAWRLSSRPGSRLRIERQPGRPPIGERSGFTHDEMAEIVFSQLENIGAARGIAPIVIVVAHGSSSLNNPHESAHDCGACGGGAGGPNARAFAQMANDPAVRERLARRGMAIPDASWFVGAERNTASNEVLFFDEDQVPPAAREAMRKVHAAFEETRRREALERCRRFDGAPHSLSPRAALRHVEARAADLAQPRPEYGHASNAFCVVGRRARSRGLFLDRRAFLVSYDPTQDADGAILERVLAAVVPVVAGINLEYYFSSVDPLGYGSGTKLPHNVFGLLGVMDGAQSDLRTGLPWQMVEIHEPVRLTIVVEATPECLQRTIAGQPDIERMLANRWLYFASLDPSSSTLYELGPDGTLLHEVRAPLVGIDGPSQRWFRGRRGHLGIVGIRTPGAAPA